MKFSGKVSHLSMKFSTTDWNFVQTKKRGRRREEEGKGRKTGKKIKKKKTCFIKYKVTLSRSLNLP